MEEVLKDERFSHILTDPRFRKIPRNVRKIKVDTRFKEMFKSKHFTEKCNVDERGRALNLESSENLKKLYEDSSISEDSLEEADEKSESLAKSKKSKTIKTEKKNKLKKKEQKFEESEDTDSEDSDLNNKIKIKNTKNLKVKKSSKEKNLGQNPKEINKSKTVLNNSSSKIKSLESNNLDYNKKKNKVFIENKNVSLESDSRFIQKSDSDSENLSNDEDDISFKKNQHSIKINTDKQKKEVIESESESSSHPEEESEDSDSDDSITDKNEIFDHEWEEQHEKAPDTDEISSRLAVCNMDWDRIRAIDLFAVFNSFKPTDTSILSVKIYPSEYGLKRMEEERLNGPPELVEKTLAMDEEEVENKKMGRYHREKLRQYQMNRLKYYYAVVECDSPETANALYEQLNGMEYESSSIRFDLRFVPDETTFDQEPTSVADNLDLTEYKPRIFVTTALQQVKVGLTWDETDPQRRETLQKAFTETDNIEKDIKEYLASSSGDSEDEILANEEGNTKLSTEERIKKYKALLESLNEQEKEKNEDKFEMEITWEPGVKEKTETLVKEKLEEKSFTPFEELQKKKKEKQKLKKRERKAKNHEELDNSMSNENESDSFTDEEKMKNPKIKSSKQNDELYLISDAKKTEENNTKTSKKKKKKEKQKTTGDTQVDVNDPRFSAIYTSPLFNIDPSDPHFKNTPGNLAIIAEKQRRLKNRAVSQEDITNKKFKYK